MRQDESEIVWRIRHASVTASTNADARMGTHGDVFTADFQTAGRGRLDHTWLSAAGENLMMSVVLSVDGMEPEVVATFPLVVGLSVAQAADGLLQNRRSTAPRPRAFLKWPNDVLADGRKLAGILCERAGDRVVAGIGVNVRQTDFPSEIAGRATSLAVLRRSNGDCPHGDCPPVDRVRDAVLGTLGRNYACWRRKGFAALYPAIAEIDWLKGRHVCVRQTDTDEEPVAGRSDGIRPDGSLGVGGRRVYAGEAHVQRIGETENVK